MRELINKIYPLRLAPVSRDADRAIEMLCDELPFTIHEYACGREHNGWQVPYGWEVLKAEIHKNGKLIYDGKRHPLGVMGYSKPFDGKVTLAELKKHLTYRKDMPDAVGYHCDYYYKPWKRDWGFSIPYSLFTELTDGEYDVALETITEERTMKVAEYILPGNTEDTIILNAHNCHAAQANDDISGIAVGIEAIKRLSSKKDRKYTYRLVIAPEHLGTVFYLAGMSDKVIPTLKYAIFLEMLGTETKFALQESFTGKSVIDKAAHNVLKYRYPDYHSGRFRKVVGNDETVWESPGYEVPCISLARTIYKEYHTDMDNIDIISEDKLRESAGVLMKIMDVIETNCRIERKFTGLIALSNPKYDLYFDTKDPSVRPEVSDEQLKWNYLMDCIIRYFDGKTTILDIALKHDMEYFAVLNYIKKFSEKGLVSFK